MRIDIRPVVREAGSSIAVSLKMRPEDLDLPQDEVTVGETIVFEGSVRNVAEKVLLLTGRMTGTLSAVCGRCGGPAKLDWTANVEATFRSEELPKTDSMAVDPEEVYAYEGFSLVPDKALRDSLLLCIPIKILCDEACKGLCAGCGANRNEKDCGCAESGRNRTSAFDQLKKLL